MRRRRRTRPSPRTAPKASGRAVLVQGGSVVLANGSSESFAAGPGRADALAATPWRTTPRRLLAAVGAAWALDIPPDLIGAGVKTFEPGLSASGSPRTLLPL